MRKTAMETMLIMEATQTPQTMEIMAMMSSTMSMRIMKNMNMMIMNMKSMNMSMKRREMRWRKRLRQPNLRMKMELQVGLLSGAVSRRGRSHMQNRLQIQLAPPMQRQS
ncbi:unnamed protein product [Durusdinium trenchii]|uniref:Uncharacterized protein n=2 Tax=Durusdinium trenchii TaxID=1381693 RepID=A0ABP0P5E4_9DINO